MAGSIRDAGPSSESSRPPQAKVHRVLENIEMLHLLQSITLEPGFIWDDFLIPYSEEQLPKDENGSLDYASDFMEEQKTFLSATSPKLIQDILTRNSDKDLPPHIQTKAISEVLQVGTPLGKGRFGEVLRVKLQASGSQADCIRSNVFAMKRMRKPAPRESSGVPRSTVSDFETELDHLSKCRHHHIIDLRASFTDEVYFGLIVSPVADFTLQELLSNYKSKNHIDEHDAARKALFDAFGCLLHAIQYLHDTLQIRHRDIKPRNILMHNYSVLICDLGSAYDFEPLDRKESTEESRPPGTRKYKAPEVLESINSIGRQSHNRKVDIFSLGCVFLEMHTVLSEQTLDQMAKFITQNETTKFEGEQGDWTYASSLEYVDRWLRKIYDSYGLGEGPDGLIRSMLCREHSKRKSADKLLHEVREKYLRYIGDCCKNFRSPGVTRPPMPIPSPPPRREPRVPMGFSIPRLITSCKFGRREPGPGFPQSPCYGEYVFSPDYPQDGELEVREDRNAWATTRSIIVKGSQSPRSIQEQWLPAYYVSVKRIRCNLTIGWSDCDQLMKERRDNQTVSTKIHCSTSSRNNLLMEVTFKDELDAADCSRLLLEEPNGGSLSFEQRLSDHRLLTIRKHEWESADKRGAGSHVAYVRPSSSSPQLSRIEPFFVPQNMDFTLSLGTDQRYTSFCSRSFWVPEYRSNERKKYELPDKAIFESVELAPLERTYPISFEEASEISFETANESGRNHLKTTYSCNKKLQQLLSVLTGWNLLVVFLAIDVQPKRRWPSFQKRPRYDVLVFQKGQETRVAIRRKEAGEENTIDWTSAILVEVDVDTRPEKLYLKLTSRQTGETLTLDTVTAAGGETQTGVDKTETWVVTVACGSGELHGIINEKRPR